MHPLLSLKIMNGDRILELRLSSSEGGVCHVILLEEEFDADGPAACLLKLTKRSGRCWRSWRKAKNNEQVVRILGLSTHTVKTHVKHILETLGVDNHAAAAVWIRAGGDE